MNNDSVNAATLFAEEKLLELQAALDGLASELKQIGMESTASHLEKAAEHAGGVLATSKKAVAHHYRPKGRMVTVEWMGWERCQPQTREVVRRTKSFVFLRLSYGGEEQYSLTTGALYGKGCDRWRILESELPALREMAVGENDVSRALRALDGDRAA